MPFDTYTLKARVAPALLMVLPLFLVIYAWLPGSLDLGILTTVGAFSLAAVVALAYEVGQAGRRIQPGLFESWGGAPTTQLLRHSGEITPDAKARFREVLAKHRPDLVLPTAQLEQQDPSAADAAYEKAVEWLREQTREAGRFPLVADENATFGFHRNLYALRGVAYAAAGVGVTGCAARLLLTRTSEPQAWLGLVVAGLCGLLVARVATEARAREAGFTYARVLLRAIEGLGK